MARRFAANRGWITRSLNLVRAMSTEGKGRIRRRDGVSGRRKELARRHSPPGGDAGYST